MFSTQEINERLSSLSDWALEGQEIKKVYQFESFVEAVVFANRVCRIAENENHHPDILIQYNKVTLTLTTHSEGGLTEKDFIFASKIDGA